MEMFQAILSFIFANIKIEEDQYLQDFFNIDSIFISPYCDIIAKYKSQK